MHASIAGIAHSFPLARLCKCMSSSKRSSAPVIAPLDCTIAKRIDLFPAVSPIPEISPSGQDSVSAMCQQLARGLSLLSSTDDYGPVITHTATSTVVKKLFSTTTTMSGLPSGTYFDTASSPTRRISDSPFVYASLCTAAA